MAAGLLQKVWDFVRNRPGFGSGSSSSNKQPDSFQQMMYLQTSPTGEFDRIPMDVFIQILKFLGPKESAKLSAVCKSWKFIVADNRLWIHFLQIQQEEPWDSIFFAETCLRSGYPLHEDGSGNCKFGWSKYASPSGRTATFLEFGNIESPMCSRLRHFFSTIYSRMQVKPYTQPVALSVPIRHSDDTASHTAARKQLNEAIYTALFDMKVPAICANNQHLESFSIISSKANLKNCCQHWFQPNICCSKTNAMLLLIMNLSFKKTQKPLFKLQLKDGEILFQPRIAGVRTMGLHQTLALCMDHCQDSEFSGDDGWFKMVFLVGGSACLPGLAERLEKEPCQSLPQSMSSGLKVVPPPYGVDSAWYGAKLISNLSTFPSFWRLTKKQYHHKLRRNLIW